MATAGHKGAPKTKAESKAGDESNDGKSESKDGDVKSESKPGLISHTMSMEMPDANETGKDDAPRKAPQSFRRLR